LGVRLNEVSVTQPPENDPRLSFTLPTWLRLFSVVVLGLIMPSLGRLVGRSVGNERAGAAVAAALFVTLLVFATVRHEGSRSRAALGALAGGAVVGVLFWLLSR
jgi:hypothetical protein